MVLYMVLGQKKTFEECSFGKFQRVDVDNAMLVSHITFDVFGLNTLPLVIDIVSTAETMKVQQCLQSRIQKGTYMEVMLPNHGKNTVIFMEI